MKRILFALLVALCAPAFAVDYYACDCGPNAQAGCSPTGQGDNANAGTSPSAPKQNFSAAFASGRAAGDRLLYCQGGDFAAAQMVGIVNTNVTPTAPLTIGSYVASWGGAGVKPILRSTAGNIIQIGYGGGDSGFNDGGYVIEDIDFDGGGRSAGVNYCIEVYNTVVRNITIRNNTIRRCGTGLYPGAFNESDPSPNTYVKITGNHIHSNWNTGGLFGACRWCLIEGNTFERNGIKGGQAHHIYFGDNGSKAEIRNNTFTGSGAFDNWNDPQPGVDTGNGQCRGGNVTIHGRWSDLHIIGNKFNNTDFDGVCAGIKVNTGYGGGRLETFDNVVVDGNEVIGGVVGIGISAAHNPLVQNNVLVGISIQGINVADSAVEAGETADFGGTYLNNSLYFTDSTSNPTCLNLSQNHGAGTGVTVRGNLCRFAAGAGVKTCFATGALSNFTDFSRNSCSNASGGTFRWSSAYATLAAAQAAGFDTNGQDGDPLVTVPALPNGWKVKPQDGSPVIGASTGCPRLSFTGRTPTTCSIGAYQSVDP